jgi:hypothetical protein
MPAASKSQQRFFGMVHAFQKGKLKSSDLPPGVAKKIKQAASSITDKAASDFASTPSKGLPVHVSEDLDFSLLTFSQHLVATQLVVEAFQELSDEEMDSIEEKWNNTHASALRTTGRK